MTGTNTVEDSLYILSKHVKHTIVSCGKEGCTTKIDDRLVQVGMSEGIRAVDTTDTAEEVWKLFSNYDIGKINDRGKMTMQELTTTMQKHLEWMKEVYQHDDKIYQLYENGIKNTFQTTLKPKHDGKTFVITGDIPAMWLRDSAAQVRTLLIFANEDEEARVIYETLPYNGLGKPVGFTGMTWSGFRPSDDACWYGYLIPSNMFAVVILRCLANLTCYSRYDFPENVRN